MRRGIWFFDPEVPSMEMLFPFPFLYSLMKDIRAHWYPSNKVVCPCLLQHFLPFCPNPRTTKCKTGYQFSDLWKEKEPFAPSRNFWNNHFLTGFFTLLMRTVNEVRNPSMGPYGDFHLGESSHDSIQHWATALCWQGLRKHRQQFSRGYWWISGPKGVHYILEEKVESNNIVRAGRRCNVHLEGLISLQVPKDDLDFRLAALYDHHTGSFKNKCEILLQKETIQNSHR